MTSLFFQPATCIPYFLAFGMPATPEWMFLGILALILFGPKKLPELAKGVGKFIAELQKAKEEFRREILNIPSLPSIKEPIEKRAYKPIALNTLPPLPTDKMAEPSSENIKAPSSIHPKNGDG
ncbi:MAG: twin-arginine translocase TatA/TatE family subunit, partial [Chthoniobacterales bacterium]